MDKSTPKIASLDLEPASEATDSLGAQETATKTPATPLRCLTGALMSGSLSLLAYRLTFAIATNFANRPVTSSNPAVVNISVAVRTLVTGMVALGAGVFGIAALGLTALGIQLWIKSISKKVQSNRDC
ncbi:MAG: DUF3082 domain-containing protein [Phormidesmis sp. RL_2_1]|nr:DUF3082 domain-containing protein [Phormidesmis sp. RL_2_1]